MIPLLQFYMELRKRVSRCPQATVQGRLNSPIYESIVVPKGAASMVDRQEHEVEFHPVVSLSKYFTWASYMRTEFDKIEKTDTVQWSDPVSIDSFMFMSFWYGTLYTVVEGWRDLKLSDPEVDSLLKSPNVKMLKLYRHGVYHFQRSYFDQRYMPFMKNPGSVPWVRALHEAFFLYLDGWFKTHDLHGNPKTSQAPRNQAKI